jgi:hypothetical protein
MNNNANETWFKYCGRGALLVVAHDNYEKRRDTQKINMSSSNNPWREPESKQKLSLDELSYKYGKNLNKSKFEKLGWLEGKFARNSKSNAKATIGAEVARCLTRNHALISKWHGGQMITALGK